VLENQVNISPEKPFYKKVFKFFLWCSITVFLFLILAVSLVFIYEDEVKSVAIKELNRHLQAEVRIDPKNIDLTFISSFPNCAIQFKKLTAMEAWKKKNKDTLLYAELLSLEFNMKDLFNKKYIIKKVNLFNAKCFLKIDKNGNENYIAWKTSPDTASGKGEGLKFKLEDISIKNFKIVYKNKEQRFKSDLEIKDLAFSGNFSESSYRLTSKGNAYINILASDKVNYIKNKNLKLDIELNVNNYNYEIKKSELTLNSMAFVMIGDFNYRDSLQNIKLEYKAKNLDIESVLSLLPDKYKSRINDYKSSGEFFANGNFNYSIEKPFSIKSKFGINKATIEYSPKNTKLSDVSVAGELLVDEKHSSLDLSNIKATLNGDNFSGNFLMTDFNDPFIEVTADGNFNLQNVYSFWPVDTLEKLEGSLKIKGRVKGLVSDIKKNTFSDKLSINVNVELEKLRTRFKNDTNDLAVESCKIIALERDIRVEDLKMNKGKSDINLSGDIPGLFNYILDKKAPLVIRGTLNSNNFYLEEFIFSGGGGTSASEEPEYNLPANVNLVLDANIKHFKFGKFDATNIKGNFELKKQKAMLTDMTFETMEGQASVDAFVDGSGTSLDLTLQSKIENINVNKMFNHLNNFGQNTLLDKNINGFVTASIDFSGSWDKKLNSLLNSVKSTAELTIERGELNDFKPLESLSKFVDLKELQRIKFSSLSSNLEIKNSTIYIPQTIIKNSALNIEFSGTHTFNNDINYHIRLLISELLAKKRKQSDDEFGPIENDPDNRRSAFILMTGNIDNIILKYDRQGMRQKIKEDLKIEKQTLKQILKEEFGAFKNDTLNGKPGNKANQKFELEKPNNNSPKKTLEAKKKKDEDDDF